MATERMKDESPEIIVKSFDRKMITFTPEEGKLWVSSRDIGVALDYADPAKAINTLFGLHKDEFDNDSTRILVSRVRQNEPPSKIREFSVEGIILLSMFSEKPKAKDFRKWAKSVLAEVSTTGSYIAPELNALEGTIKQEILEIKSNLASMQKDFLSYLGDIKQSIGQLISGMGKPVYSLVPDNSIKTVSLPRSEPFMSAIQISKEYASPSMRVAMFYHVFKGDSSSLDRKALAAKLLVSTSLISKHACIEKSGHHESIQRIISGKSNLSREYGKLLRERNKARRAGNKAKKDKGAYKMKPQKKAYQKVIF